MTTRSVLVHPIISPRLAALAESNGGVFTRGDAISVGYTDDEIARLVRLSRWHRVRRGAYVLAATWTEADEPQRHLVTCRAVLRALRGGTYLAGVSALVAHGAALYEPDLSLVHVVRGAGTAPRMSGRREAGCRHSDAELPPEQRMVVGGLPCSAPARALVDHAREEGVSFVQAVIAMDSLLRAGVVARSELTEVRESQRAWQGSRRAGAAVDASDGRAQSPGETVSRLQLGVIGFPLEALQFLVETDRGTFWADGAWVSRRVLMEFDGRIKYGPGLRGDRSVEDVLVAERQRELALERAGWVVLRLTWADLWDLDRLRSLVLGAFERAARLFPTES